MGSATNKPQAAHNTSSRDSTLPETAKSMKPPAARKPRTTGVKAPAPTKPPTKRANFGAPPLSRQASNASDKTSGALQPTSSNQSRQASGASDASADVDSITNAMKGVSIKLKMPTEEQHVANQKKREDEQRVKQAKATRKAPAPKLGKAKVPTKSAAAPPLKPRENSQATSELQPGDNTGTPAAEDIAPESTPVAPSVPIPEAPVAQPLPSLPVPSADPSIPEPANGQNGATYHSYSMAPPPPPLLASQDPSSGSTLASTPARQEPDLVPPTSNEWVGEQHSHPQNTPAPSQWSFTTPMPPPPPMGTSSRPMTPNKKTKADLPVFTSTSPIPFSPRTNNTLNEEQTKQEHEGRSIWDLPETPR